MQIQVEMENKKRELDNKVLEARQMCFDALLRKYMYMVSQLDNYNLPSSDDIEDIKQLRGKLEFRITSSEINIDDFDSVSSLNVLISQALINNNTSYNKYPCEMELTNYRKKYLSACLERNIYNTQIKTNQLDAESSRCLHSTNTRLYAYVLGVSTVIFLVALATLVALYIPEHMPEAISHIVKGLTSLQHDLILGFAYGGGASVSVAMIAGNKVISHCRNRFFAYNEDDNIYVECANSIDEDDYQENELSINKINP